MVVLLFYGVMAKVMVHLIIKSNQDGTRAAHDVDLNECSNPL